MAIRSINHWLAAGQLGGKDTLEGETPTVIEELKKRRMKKYLRYREPVLNKKALIEDRKSFDDLLLEALGIRFSQKDDFYVEPADASCSDAAERKV